MWTLRYSERAIKQLKKLDPYQAKLVRKWMLANIDGCDDPRAFGHVLHCDLYDLWRYRAGKYRVFCEIHDDKLVVLAIEIGYRAEIYR